MIEKRTTFGNFTDSNHLSMGLYLFRIVTAIPMTEGVAKKAIIDKIIAEIQGAKVEGNIDDNTRDRLVLDWGKLEISKTLLFKETKHLVGDKEYFYYQMIISHEDADDNRREGIFYDIMRRIYRGWNMNDAKAYNRMPDFIYQIAEIGADANKTILSSDDRLNEQALNNIMVPEYNIVVSTLVDPTKFYNRNSIVKVRYAFYSTMIEAFEKKDGQTYTINDYSVMFPPLRFGQVGSHRNGSYNFRIDYKSNPHLEFINGVAVFWDGKKSRDCVMPYIPELAEKNIKMVNILQFCNKKDFFYGDMRSGLTSRKVIFHFMARERIYTSYCDLRLRNGKVEGRILCLPVNNKKKVMYNLAVQNGSGYVAELIIPVDEKNSQDAAIAKATTLILNKLGGYDMAVAFSEYKYLLFDAIQQDEDILSQWFSYCTRNMRNTDDNIVRTYVNMKKTLEREYKEIRDYLNCYDFSKCQPIPRVTADKKLLENYYKSLQIEPKNIIIKSINNKKIKPISEIQPTVRFMVRDKKNFNVGETPLNKYYNGKTNEIELYYTKMKGEVTHVKTQNWR